jgi:hypothetical protein
MGSQLDIMESRLRDETRSRTRGNDWNITIIVAAPDVDDVKFQFHVSD